jgi:tetratricopeptide (TPR) repeat protein
MEAVFRAGEAAVVSQKWDEAAARFGEVLQLDPRNEAALYNRAKARMELKQPELAIADLDEYIELRPRDADAYVDRGYCYRAKGDDAKAIADFDAATAINPNYSELSGYARGTVLGHWLLIGVGLVMLLLIAVAGRDLFKRLRSLR